MIKYSSSIFETVMECKEIDIFQRLWSVKKWMFFDTFMPFKEENIKILILEKKQFEWN